VVRTILVAVAAMAWATSLPAQRVAIAPKAGTTGAGADLTIRIAPVLNVRLGAQGWSRSETRTEQQIEYDAELSLVSGQVLLDLHPGERGFRISAGAVVNGNEVTAVSTEDAVYVLNGTPYPVGLVGRLRGSVETNSVAPYAGIGWGNAVAPGSRWRFAADLGAFYQGRPKVALRAESPLLPLLPDSFFEDLEAERQEIEADLADYTWYPVVSLGVSYRF
jgi:hypothetical protein